MKNPDLFESMTLYGAVLHADSKLRSRRTLRQLCDEITHGELTCLVVSAYEYRYIQQSFKKIKHRRY